jgi:hypothetical protein
VKYLKTLFVVVATAFAASDAAVAPLVVATDAVSIPKLLSYQGRLTDTMGVPVPDGSYSVVFRLYTVPSGGTHYWTETQSVQTRGGIFSALLGSVTPVGTVPDAGALYLGMAVSGGAEMTPRVRIASVAYAYKADTANYALAGGGGGAPDSVPGSFAVSTDLRVYGKGRIGPFNSNAGTAAFAAGYNVAADGNYSSVAGGYGNAANGAYAFIGSGIENVAGDSCATVAGGSENTASGRYSFAGGGISNTAGNYAAAVVGGELNSAGGVSSAVAGGYRNSAAGNYGAVVGGRDNSASGQYAVVGGRNDTASALHSAALSGYRNRARDSAAVVCGGDSNSVRSRYGFVGGGRANRAESSYALVVGGRWNAAAGRDAAVGGGQSNSASALATFVGGGAQNNATASHATVGGGSSNDATATQATVGGGGSNEASGHSSTVGGGMMNEATMAGATVAGGNTNHAYGAYSMVPGGLYNTAGANMSLAAGHWAQANHRGSFVWSDSATSSGEAVQTTGTDQFRVRARGGTWFFSNAGMTTGATLAAGSNSWASACDRANKEDFRPVDRRELLERVAALPVQNYKMRDQLDGTRHIGPVAQDFAAAFGAGENNTTINMADADGVLFAAVQALYEQNRAQQAQIDALLAELGWR